MRLPYGTTSADLNAYKNSNFYGHEAETLTSVDGVATAATNFLELFGDVSEASYNDYVKHFNDDGTHTGETPLDYETWAKQQKELTIKNVCGVVGETFLSKYGLDENSSYTEISNAMVLEMASKASTMTAETALNGYITSNGDLDLMTYMGLNIALLTGYVNSDNPDQEVVEAYNDAINNSDPNAVFNLAMSGISSDAFESYLLSAFAMDGDDPIENDDGTFVLNTASDAYTDVAGCLAAL